MTDPVKLLANIVGCQDLLHNAVHVKQICVMRGVAVFSLRLDLALYKKLVVIKVAVIGGYAIIVAHVLTAQAFLPSLLITILTLNNLSLMNTLYSR